jgi:repressor LexA
MLTRKQSELLLFINGRIKEAGISPSFDEMKEALGLKSKSGIHRLITGLEERGFIRRLPHRARALEVLRLPDTAAVDVGGGSANVDDGFTPTVVRGHFRPTLHDATAASGGESVQLPLYGRIAAGTPITALSDNTQFFEAPPGMLRQNREHYALEVDGDSMLEAGILDGDTVIIERCETAENGAIVVALIEDEEVTLKRLRRKGHSIALEPANRKYETRIFGPEQVKIQGRLVGLVRTF